MPKLLNRKYSFLQELSPVEHEVCRLLLPLAPSVRYAIVSDQKRMAVLASCRVGETVVCKRSQVGSPFLVGLIQYVGPLPLHSGNGRGRYVCLNDLDGQSWATTNAAWIGKDKIPT